MKVYVLTSGEYSDYGVVGVFSSVEKMKEFEKEFPFKNWLGDGYDYLELEVDELLESIKFIEKMKRTPYSVRMSKSGEVVGAYKMSGISYIEDALSGRYTFDFKNALCVIVFAKDKEHAVKIVNELRTKLIALDMWKGGKNRNINLPWNDYKELEDVGITKEDYNRIKEIFERQENSKELE